MKTASKCISALFMTTVLAGCGLIPAQNRSAIDPTPDLPSSQSTGWARVVEMDSDSVRLGQLPPEVIQYDLQIAQMITEAQEIMASHDKAKARVWLKKMNAINVARNKAIGRMETRQMAANSAAPDAWGDGKKPDPCLSPMGKNICTAPSEQQAEQRGGINYTAVPGGIEATVGGLVVGPGGIGGTLGH